MFVLKDYSTAIVFCIVTMLCWGSWSNAQKLGKGRRFELFYWDYVIGVLLTTIVFAFSLGSSGSDGRGFLADVRQATAGNLGSALLGGMIFNAANLLLVAAIAKAGMAVAFPVGIGLALVIGVVVNFVAHPKGNPLPLFVGVGLIAAAIILDALAYRRCKHSGTGGSRSGLILAIVCGVLMGFFYRFVAAAISTDFVQMEAGKISPYTAMVCFAVGVLISNFVFNVAPVMKAIGGTTVSARDFFAGAPVEHCWGVLGGAVWAVGMTFSMIAFGIAGPAVSYGLGQGATMVAAFWGVFIWREFRDSLPGTYSLIALMFVGYISGLAFIIFAGMA